jgi:hypothetical protein
MLAFGHGAELFITVNQPIYTQGPANPPALTHFNATKPYCENAMAVITLLANAIVQDGGSLSSF